MLPPPATAVSSTLTGTSVPFGQAGTTPANGGLLAFLGFTALVLTGFLVLARLSQRVVDDAEETESGHVSVPAGPAPGDPDAGERPDGSPHSSGANAVPGDATTDREDGTDEVGTASPGEYGPFPPAERTRGDRTAAERTRQRSDDAAQTASIPPGALLANVALTQGLFGGVLAAAAWFFQVPETALGLAGGPVDGVAAVAVGLAFGVVLWLGNEATSALADAAGAGYDAGLRQLLAPADARGWAILLGGVLPVVALVEEFIFRAAAVGAASAALGATPAVAWTLAVVSSLAFALGHGAQGRVGVVVTGALGFVLAAGFLLSGSFVVVVVAHYVVNALEFLAHEAAGLPDPVWA